MSGREVANAAGPSPPPVEAYLDRVYRRLGWRIFPAHLAVAWLVGLFFSFVGPLVFRGFENLSDTATEDLIGFFAATWAISVAAVVMISIVLTHPLRRQDRRPDITNAHAAWMAVVRMPQSLITWVGPTAMLIGVLGAILSVAAVGPLNGAVLLLVGVGSVGGVVLLMTGALLSLPIVTRPVLRSLSRWVGGDAAVEGGFSLRGVLMFLTPTIAITTAMLSTAFEFQRGQNKPTALLHLAVATAVATAVYVPASFVLAQRILQPVRDLLDATERLTRGEFDKPVPRTTVDEFSVLASSFNDAMRGLADRARLADENAELLRDVIASRARIVAAGYEARRRVERDIHDGVQQRLIAATMELGRSEDAAIAMPDSEALRSSLNHAASMLTTAIVELRELARGVHPAVLTTDGLREAIGQLANLAPVPVTVAVPTTRFNSTIETTAYFVVAEALTNVAKHAAATQACVIVENVDDVLVVTITDDGVGGATRGGGSGLTSIEDRTAALGGALSVRNIDTGGTCVQAVIPLGVDEPSRPHIAGKSSTSRP